MIYPTRILVLMALTLAAVAAGCAAAYKPLAAVSASNVVFHAAIAAMLAIGIVLQLAQTATLVPATRWIDRTRRGFAAKTPPRVIAPVATVLAGHERAGFTVSMLAMRSLLEAVEARLKQARLQYASLLSGLASAVVPGLLYLEFRHAQSAFLVELQSFLSERAQRPSALLGGEG